MLYICSIYRYLELVYLYSYYFIARGCTHYLFKTSRIRIALNIENQIDDILEEKWKQFHIFYDLK